jgi:hypothetical protein
MESLGNMSQLVAIVKSPRFSQDVVFEDDGRVAYAYLRDGAKLISDVWLYNSGPTPDVPEWTDPSRMPFANPREFTAPESPPELHSPKDVSARWIGDDNHQLIEVEVYLKGELFAKLAPGAKPGWSRLARKAGPLALPLAG